ncbi:ArnT family glycosyltransferase [Sporomusa aerivorans]|uniref:ArnT family glycosyltransferase n=1 Tax=Sporomusa aerivorans TaxID=204936 RepID=UPI00352AFED5
MNKNTWLEIITVLIVAGFIMAFRLGGLPLLDPDEPVYAQTAREMLAAQDFVSPRIYGDFWYDKPPMYYWLVAGAMKIAGQTELAARLPSALFAVGGALLVYAGGRSLLNRRAGLIAGLALATSLEYFYLGKAAVTDATLTFFMSACLLLYLRRKYHLAYIAAGLAVLTKGPVGFILPGLIILIHLVVTRSMGQLRRIKLLSGSLLVLAVSLPWYWLMYQYHGMDFVDTFLGFHNVTRFLQPEHASGSLWYYYIPVLIIGFFPWTIFLVQALTAAIRAGHDHEQGSKLVFFVIWATVIFAFFSLSQTKLISYILPMFPPLALLVGWYTDRCLSSAEPGVFKIPAVLLTLLVTLVEAAFFIIAKQSIPELFPGTVTAGILFAIVLGLAWYTVYTGRNKSFVGVLVAGMTAFVIVLMTVLLPAAAPWFSVKDLAGEFQAQYDGQAPVYISKSYRPGFTYYTGTPGTELETGELKNLVSGDSGKAYFVLKKKTYLGLPPAEQSKLQLIATQKDVALVMKKNN